MMTTSKGERQTCKENNGKRACTGSLKKQKLKMDNKHKITA